MKDRARVFAAETFFLPDMRVESGRRAELDLRQPFLAQVPPDPVEPFTRGPLKGPDLAIVFVKNFDPNTIPWGLFEIIVDGRTVGGRPAAALVIRRGVNPLTGLEPVGGSGYEEVRFRSLYLRSELLQGSHIIQDPDASAVRPHDEVIEMLLKRNPGDTYAGEIGLEGLPAGPIIS
jgi:hypothetical protein